MTKYNLICILVIIISLIGIILINDNLKDHEITLYELYDDMKHSSLNAKAVHMSLSQLKNGYIIHIKNHNSEYFGCFKEFNGNNMIIKSEKRNIRFDKDFYTGQALIFNNSTQFSELSVDEMKSIKGTFIKYSLN